MNISFSPPDISELEINEVVDALKSGWITTGPRTKLEIASGTDAQPGYEVSVLSGVWGNFTNKQFRAGITWALLAR